MRPTSTGPAAAGLRVPYDDLPPEVHAWVEGVLGSPVAQATTQIGGFSPGVAARLRCADGTRAFVKAVSADANADSPALHRREASVLQVLPEALPVPRLLASYDENPWVALLVEDVEGRQPGLPWRLEELDQMLALTRAVSAQRGVAVRPAAEHVARWQGWRKLTDAAAHAVDPWAARNLDRLRDLEAAAVDAAAGDHLAHLDTRADNVLLGAGRTWLVDWPWASSGPRWLDLVASAPAVAMQGGPSPQDYVARSGLVQRADEDALTAVIAGFTGMLAEHSALPPPPGLPTVRAFQAAQAKAGVAWLQTIMGA
ncbi:MAG TPA: hypothetical protein VFH54_07410 [Mycobacteriales bacterium]|nr:hypothetical protein [Mycobacteriales bacterium]